MFRFLSLIFYTSLICNYCGASSFCGTIAQRRSLSGALVFLSECTKLCTIYCLYKVGEMNIELLIQDSLTEKYTNFLINHVVEQIIPEASLIVERSSVLIDHIICKKICF